MSSGAVLLASYPRSGSTWVRLAWAHLAGTAPGTEGALDPAPAPQPHRTLRFVEQLGLDPRGLTGDEIDLVRARLDAHAAPDTVAGRSEPGWPPLRKTHERHRLAPDGRELFPAATTRAVVLLVRDPRDVACSWAPFFGVSLDDAVEAVCRQDLTWPGSPADGRGRQVLGSWDQHVESWGTCGLPMTVVRYEDLVADPRAGLREVAAAAGLAVRPDALEAAVAATSFDRLARQEAGGGFDERPVTSRAPFFRRGVPGGWRDVLDDDQAARMVDRLGSAMQACGYPA